MKIFLAGENGKDKIIPLIHGGKDNAYFSCKPTYNSKIRGGQELAHYLFIHHNEDIFSRQHNFSEIHCPEPARGGFSVNENISCRNNTVQREEKHRGGFDKAIKEWKPYILESFFYCDSDTERLIPYYGDFLLDSGAFTFMQNSKAHLNWEEYIERYADFINKNKIEKFFELDIDSVVGYDKVLEYRKRLERLTNKQVIPVWHTSRGIKEFQKMCDQYPYVAIGGIVSKEIKSEQYKLLPALIQEAHKRKAKIHGLGFTSLSWLPKCHFDSVDSTAWTTGNRFGFVYHFDGKTMKKVDCPKGKRLSDSRKVALINYTEWIKFQKYAERNL